MPIYVKVPRRLGHLQHRTFHIFAHRDLATQPARLRQSECHIQHVLFIFRSFLQRIEQIWFQNQMTRRAGANAFAGTFQIDIMAMRDLKQGFADAGLHDALRVIGLHEGHGDGRCIVTNGRSAVPSFG